MKNKVEARENKNKRYIIATIISLVVLLVLLLFIFVFFPMFSKGSKGPTQYSREVSVTDITSETSLVDKSLTFSYNDGEEVVTFTSTSAGVFIGGYPSPTYIYCAKSSSPNTVSITYSNGTFSNLSFKVTVSDDSGNNQRLLNEDEFVVNDKTFTYSSSSSIYIYKVVIDYYK